MLIACREKHFRDAHHHLSPPLRATLAMADIVSVAYVVDASLALASEWHQVLAEYLLPLLQRLAEAHTNPQVSSSRLRKSSIITTFLVPTRCRVLWACGDETNPFAGQAFLRAPTGRDEGATREARGDGFGPHKLR